MITHLDIATFTWPVWLLVVVLLVVFFAGVLAGNLTSRVEAEKKLEEARSRAETAVQQARGEMERAAARIAHAERMASSKVKPLPGITLLRLWLDSAERPALDLDGQSVDSAQLSDAQRGRLVHLLNVIHLWLDGKPAASESPMQARMTPTFQPAPGRAAQAASKKEEKPVEPTSIVSQINTILQARLASSPLAQRDIHMEESSEGGVTVWVEKQKFSSVGEVTDPEVQALIRASIAEWEKKYTPGL